MVVAANCFYFSTGLNNNWLLIWLGPIPLFVMLFYTRAIMIGFFATWIAYFIGSLSLMAYPAFFPKYWLLYESIIGSFISASVLVISALIIKRTTSIWAIWIYPLSIVLLEYISRNNINSGTLGNLAYTQFDNKIILQLASLTGIWGISFMVSLFPVAIGTCIYFWRHSHRKAVIVILILFLLLGGSIGFGSWRFFYQKSGRTPVKIGLLAIAQNYRDLKYGDPFIQSRRYLEQVPAIVKKGGEIIVMPEKIISVGSRNKNGILNLFQTAAKVNHVMLIFGFREHNRDKEKWSNVVYVISSEGKIVASYHKIHLLPSSEGNYTAGDRLSFFMFKGVKIGLAICKDMDFIHPAADYGRNGVKLMIVPALDFKVDAFSHAIPATVRGVENDYIVVRSAQWGLLTISTPYGQIVAKRRVSDNKASWLIETIKL